MNRPQAPKPKQPQYERLTDAAGKTVGRYNPSTRELVLVRRGQVTRVDLKQFDRRG